MVNKYYKKTKISFKKKHVKDPKIFLKNKKKRQYHRKQKKNLSEEEKLKKIKYMRNSYLAHKK